MRRLIFLAFFLLLPAPIFAQAFLSVPAGDRVYRAIDRLVAAGIVDRVIVGQRPYSRGEVAGILIEAEKNFDRLADPTEKMMVWRVLKFWKDEYGDEIDVIVEKSHGKWDVKFLKRLDIDFKYLSGPDRNIYNNGLGMVDAHIRPITEYRSGRHYANGYNYSFESYHSFIGPYFAVLAHPRFQFQMSSGDNEGENGAFVQELYWKLGTRNFEFEIGRDEIIWGQGEFGGLMFSNNARPMDFIKITNQHPLKIPVVGNFKGSVFISNLGPKYDFKYAYLTAAKISLKPVDFAEAGVYFGFIWGGRNSPSVKHADGMGGVDFRFRIPPVWDAEAYGELYFEAFDFNHLDVTFADKAAYLGGFYLPRLGGLNNMAIRLEYKHLAPYIYRGMIWQDGFALSGELLGDLLGPDSDGVYANYYYDLGSVSRLILRFAFERRGGDLYNMRQSNKGLITVISRPSEKRYRGTIGIEHPIKKIVTLRWFFGYEAIEDFNFVSGNSRDSTFGGINLSLNLDI